MATRPPFLFRGALLGVGAASPIVCSAVDLLVRSPTRLVGRDFAGFWAAGRLALNGQPSAAYDPRAIFDMMRPLANISFSLLYPPQTLSLLAPSAILPYYAALLAWTVLGCAVFMLAAKRFVPFSPWLAIATPAALLNIWQGQFAFFFGALWLLTFSRGPFASGIAAGLSSFKPQLAMMLVPRVIADRRTLLASLLSALFVALIFLPLWKDFFTAVRAQAGFVATADSNSLFLKMMPGPYAAYGRSWAAHLFFAGCAIAVLARYRNFDAFTLATATFLIVPYAHNYDMTVACLGLATMLWNSWRELGFMEKAVLATGYVSPELTFVAAWLDPLVLLLCLVIQSRSPGEMAASAEHAPSEQPARVAP